MIEFKTYDHVMIDIETMSLHPHNALILSVGMIEFDPTDVVNGLKIGKRKLITPEITPQLLMGRVVDASTQKWWREQSKEAREHWLEACEHWSPYLTVMEVREFCAKAQFVWANGTQFDLSNLVELNAQVRVEAMIPKEVGPLWHYQAATDMRSFCNQTPPTRLIPLTAHTPLFAHDPVNDCINQAWRVWEHWQS